VIEDSVREEVQSSRHSQDIRLPEKGDWKQLQDISNNIKNIDSTIGYEQIKEMRDEAVTLRMITSAPSLKAWLGQFIAECDSKLPSHRCWLEDKAEHIVLESKENGWKHILAHVEFEYEDLEEVCYACVKRYELKDQLEPPSYNQAPPGLYRRYPYLYRIKISHETWLELTKLYCERIIIRRQAKAVLDDETFERETAKTYLKQREKEKAEEQEAEAEEEEAEAEEDDS
jgi:hypothetical protein